MKIGGEGVETRVVDNVLEIRSRTRMMGYLNAESFDMMVGTTPKISLMSRMDFTESQDK